MGAERLAYSVDEAARLTDWAVPGPALRPDAARQACPTSRSAGGGSSSASTWSSSWASHP